MHLKEIFGCSLSTSCVTSWTSITLKMLDMGNVLNPAGQYLSSFVFLPSFLIRLVYIDYIRVLLTSGLTGISLFISLHLGWIVLTRSAFLVVKSSGIKGHILGYEHSYLVLIGIGYYDHSPGLAFSANIIPSC